jgi:hypothetical protein
MIDAYINLMRVLALSTLDAREPIRCGRATIGHWWLGGSRPGLRSRHEPRDSGHCVNSQDSMQCANARAHTALASPITSAT